MAVTQAKAAFGYRFKRAGVDIAEVVALGGVSLTLEVDNREARLRDFQFRVSVEADAVASGEDAAFGVA